MSFVRFALLFTYKSPLCLNSNISGPEPFLPKTASRLTKRCSATLSSGIGSGRTLLPPQQPFLKTSTIKQLRADTLKQCPNVLLTCFERTVRQSHIKKHAEHYHLSAKRPSVLNNLFGPRLAR